MVFVNDSNYLDQHFLIDEKIKQAIDEYYKQYGAN